MIQFGNKKTNTLNAPSIWCFIAIMTAGVFGTPLAHALTIGVTAGPHVIILDEVKKACEAEGLPLKIVEFNDFILPNAALNQGDLDLNSYQHQPFLDDQVKTRGYKLSSIAKTILLPLGIYSKKHKSLNSISVGAKISIPNDPTNGGRALLLLQKAGVLKLKNQINPSVLDISENTQKVKLIEIEAPQLPRTLDDVDYSVINTDWIILAGMDPKTSLSSESSDSPYTNLIVVRKGDENRKDIQKFISIYQSKAIKKFILKTFKGAVIPVW